MTDGDREPGGRRLLIWRLAIGLGQGLALYALHAGREEIAPGLGGALWCAALLAPVAVMAAQNRLRPPVFAAWITAAALIAAGVGGYYNAVWSRPAGQADDLPAVPVVMVAGAALFVLHQLIVAWAQAGRWRAAYRLYFDNGWLDAVRLALAALFLVAFWLLLHLGAALFGLLGLDVVRKVIGEEGFAFPATGLVFAVGAHLTDVRSQMVRGARTLALTLLSWLLPVLAVFAAAFLATTPFTGLDALWATRSATGTMLAVCAGLVVLINAAYQDGDEIPPLALRWAARAAGVALAPLAGIAAYGLAIRIGQYGLSPARVVAAVALGVASAYALGYLAAALWRGPWMKRLETANWVCAHLAVVSLLLVLSPVLDPARLSVDDQVGRLKAGRVDAAAFDYQFLRFDSGVWGQRALAKLTGSSTPLVAAKARAVLAQEAKTYASSQRPQGRLHADGSTPPSFLTQAWPADADPARFCTPNETCEAIGVDVDGKAGPEVVVFARMNTPQVYALRDGRWGLAGQLAGAVCRGDPEAVRDGRWRMGPPAPALEVTGRRLVFQPAGDCPEQGAGQQKGAK